VDATQAQTQGGRFYSVLGYANFRRLWIGQVISNAGDTFTSMAQLILVNQITGSTLALAGMAIAITLPRLLFGLIAGVFVDRLDRRKLMIVSDLLRALLVLPMALVHSPDQVWIFYICGFAMSTVATLFDPAKGAILPSLVPESELTRANALSQTTWVLASLVGPLLAGFILEATTASIAFVIDGVSFLVSAFFIWRLVAPPFVPKPRRDEATGGTAIRQVLFEAWEGLRALLGTRVMLVVSLVFSVMMFGLGAINVLAVAFLTRGFGVGAGGLGLVMTMQAVGMLVGSVVLGQWLTKARPGWVLGGGLALIGVSLAAMPFVPTYPIVLALCVVIGLGVAPIDAVAATLIQTSVPDHQRGRVGAGMNTLIVVANLLSMSLAGVAGAALGIANVFVAGGAIVLAAAGLAVLLLGPVSASAPAAPVAGLAAEM